jgi:hypothetical protein
LTEKYLNREKFERKNQAGDFLKPARMRILQPAAFFSFGCKLFVPKARRKLACGETTVPNKEKFPALKVRRIYHKYFSS